MSGRGRQSGKPFAGFGKSLGSLRLERGERPEGEPMNRTQRRIEAKHDRAAARRRKGRGR